MKKYFNFNLINTRILNFFQGNKENCITLLNHKIIDYINLLLRKRDFGSCTVEQVMEFRYEVGGLLYCLMEEYSQEDKGGTAQVLCSFLISDLHFSPLVSVFD